MQHLTLAGGDANENNPKIPINLPHSAQSCLFDSPVLDPCTHLLVSKLQTLRNALISGVRISSRDRVEIMQEAERVGRRIELRNEEIVQKLRIQEREQKEKIREIKTKEKLAMKSNLAITQQSKAKQIFKSL